MITPAAIALASVLAADPTTAVRGLAASVEVEYAPTLRARSEQLPTTPVLVRVARVGPTRQRVEFIGSVAGAYDLRDFLEREDGQLLTDLPALPVSVVSKLPPGHGADLFDSGESWFNWRARYREILLASAVAWACVPVAYLLWRAARRPRPVPVAPPPPPMTVERQLREALESAGARVLSVEERGRLELLVFRYFAQRLGRPDLETADAADVCHAVRETAETRPLVIALERWLHAPRGEDAARHAAQALDELRRTRLGAPAREAVGGPA